MARVGFLIVVSLTFGVTLGKFHKQFDDSVMFDLQWTDEISKEYLQSADTETLFTTSSDNEKYMCALPKNVEKGKYKDEKNEVVNPLDLLSSIFSYPTQCFYRMESYWKYELCHGMFLRQYHERTRGKDIVLQEYYLGKWDQEQKNKYYKELEENKTSLNAPMKRINGINMPYLLINMTNGSTCDVTNRARSTRVYYVCYEYGKYEIASLEETSICEYEVVVLSPHLCKHPKFRVEKNTANVIKCQPLDGAPTKPKNLMALEAESLTVKHQKLFDKNPMNMPVEMHPIMIALDITKLKSRPVSSYSSLPTTSIIKRFLSGQHCIVGGSGWWNYEFCYGVSISQFHRERNGEKAILYLGKFLKNKHVEWLSKNPHKRPKPIDSRKQISHLYSEGTLCDKTGQSRQTEVKLKCVKNSVSPSSIAIFMYEPKLCEYVLHIESAFICDVLPYADENGIIDYSKDSDKGDETVIPADKDDTVNGR